MPRSQAIHIVDDDLDLRRSLMALLHARGFEAVTHECAEHLLERANPDMGCIISDTHLPGMDGLQLMTRVRQMRSTVPFIFVTRHGNVALAVKAMKLGAVDCLVKPFASCDLLAAVEPLVAPSRNESARCLSKRESEVLRGVIDGETNKQIARALGISPRTVEAYRAHVMRKMSAANVPQLVKASMRAGLDAGGRVDPAPTGVQVRTGATRQANLIRMTE